MIAGGGMLLAHNAIERVAGLGDLPGLGVDAVSGDTAIPGSAP